MKPVSAAIFGMRHAAERAGFEAAMNDPEATMRAVLMRMVHAQQATQFGEDHGFRNMRTAEDFMRAVPVRQFEDFAGYLRDTQAGRADILTHEPAMLFVRTSGTTGQPKDIPLTESAYLEMKRANRVWLDFAVRAHPRMLRGKTLLLTGAEVEGRLPSGLSYGAMSGVAASRIPAALRRRMAIPYEIALCASADVRYFVSTRIALQHSVTAVSSANPSSLHMLAAVMRHNAETCLRALHDGTLGIDAFDCLPEADAKYVRRALESACRPMPARARELAKIIERNGVLRPADAWPSLELIGCWLGGSVGAQAQKLADAYGDVALRDLGLMASEGRFTLPTADGEAFGPLCIDSSWIEGIAEDDGDAGQPIPAYAFQPGRRYRLIVTTASGLWRYDLNDIVEVRGFYGKTPCVAFVRKGRDMHNITGEKLHVNHLIAAFAHMQERLPESVIGPLSITQFQCIPNVDAMAYDVLVEFDANVTNVPTDPSLFAKIVALLDDGLASANLEYAAKRSSRRLGPPRLFLMQSGWSGELAARAIAAGSREQQFKFRQMPAEWEAESRAAVRDSFLPADTLRMDGAFNVS